MITGKYKPFEGEKYVECDKLAKSRVCAALEMMGYVVHERSEDYGVDIKAFREDVGVTYHEVEIKRVWTGKWPKRWKTVHVPERKKKLKGAKLVFWLLSGDLERAKIVPSEELRDEFLEEVKNKEIAEGEMFYCVPIERTKELRLRKDGKY